MIRFSISGEYLDLPADFSLQFKKSNVLFAFDNMECERSTSFDIPATPQNDRIFQLAKWIAAPGTGMRRRFDAQMQNGIVVKNGYLYVDAYADGKYKAIFVTGELLGLKRLRDIGSINESGLFDDYSDSVYRGAGSQMPASEAYDLIWANVSYEHSADTDIFPSIGVSKMLRNMGINDSGGVIDGLKLRLIVTKPQPIQEDTAQYGVNIINSHTGGYTPVGSSGSPIYNVSVPNFEAFDDEETFPNNALFDQSTRVLVKYTNGGVEYHGYVVLNKAKYDTSIFFGSGTPDDYFIGYFSPQTDMNQHYSLLSDFIFIGGWSFDENGAETGTPLKNRWVDIPADGYFIVIRKSWWNQNGWQIQTPDFTLLESVMNFSGWENSDDAPAVWRLKDNLPNCTAVDILKAIAAMTGTILNYTEDNGIVFEPLILNGEQIEIDDKIIKVSTMERKFADYAQNNYIKFADDSAQYDNEKKIINYPIDNDNIEAYKILLTLPAGSGGIYSENSQYQVLYLRGGESVNILAVYDSREPIYLCRPVLQKNNDIQSLCDASTSVQMQVRMTLLEFEQLKPKTRIYYDGVLYVWTEAQYSKDVVTLKLSKINA